MAQEKDMYDYDPMDRFKRNAQAAARTTNHFVERFGFKVVDWSRGESAFLIETPAGYLAFLVEGLGTKNLVADAMYAIVKHLNSTGNRSFYDQIAQCNVAMQVNDMITLGALPISLGQYVATSDSDWFKDEARCADLIEGTRKAAVMARCCWGPGETPALMGVIVPGATDLAGAAVGWIADKSRVFNPEKIRDGDIIMVVESLGINANHLTKARNIAAELKDGYMTKLSDGRTFGETLLDPTHILVGFIEDVMNAGVDIHYGVNVTGHGLRKLMRAEQSFTYVVERLPTLLPVFEFMQEKGNIVDYDAFGKMNMGVQLAAYVRPEAEGTVVRVADSHGLKAFAAGYVRKSDEKKVIIQPKNIVFKADTLQVR
ncbi:MAG: hypothetical protein JWM46_322 [Candidatus Kaiserbacteria bacterium]|nr:hypothetical protein [Candidatus Kaiserbacteria bacterium]